MKEEREKEYFKAQQNSAPDRKTQDVGVHL